MTWIKLTHLDVGAPSLNPVNGALTAIFRWALPQAGWAIEFGPTGNAAVFRASVGNRHRFCINNNAGASEIALVRGAETATSATAWARLFPTAAQVTNASSVWQCGHASNVGGTPWVIYLNETFFYFLVNQIAWAGQPYWELHAFGDVPSNYGTGYETLMTVRTTTDSTSPYIISSTMTGTAVGSNITHYWCRGINGVTKSTLGAWAGTANQISYAAGMPVTRTGYLNRLLRQKIGINCNGATNTTATAFAIPYRGWAPNLWNPLHSNNVGAMADQDTFIDTVYNPAASFRWYGYSGGTYGFIIEETDTWSIP